MQGIERLRRPQVDKLPCNRRRRHPEPQIPINCRLFTFADQTKPAANEPVRYFGPYKPLDRSPGGGLTPLQQEHLDNLIAAYTARTPRSKAYTQKHRKHFADPRTVAGFRPQWKEMVYPIVVKHSHGSRFWDIDGNEYLDFSMGFGTNLFGHNPEFLARAMNNQLGHGVEVGPQNPIAGKVASLLCHFSKQERAAFASSGSEAVLAAIRMARTVTGRTRIATTSGYHGINDEVLVRSTVVDGVRKPVPIAPGIPQHAVDQVLVLDYGSPESLELLRAHAHELAAVLIEPVQARRPDLQPREFLQEVRKITAASETAPHFRRTHHRIPHRARRRSGMVRHRRRHGHLWEDHWWRVADRRDLRQGEVSSTRSTAARGSMATIPRPR